MTALLVAAGATIAAYCVWAQQSYRIWAWRRPAFLAFCGIQILSTLQCCVGLDRELAGHVYVWLLGAHKLAFLAAIGEGLWKLTRRREVLAAAALTFVVTLGAAQAFFPVNGNTYRFWARSWDLLTAWGTAAGSISGMLVGAFFFHPRGAHTEQAIYLMGLLAIAACRAVSGAILATHGRMVEGDWLFPVAVIGIVCWSAQNSEDESKEDIDAGHPG